MPVTIRWTSYQRKPCYLGEWTASTTSQSRCGLGPLLPLLPLWLRAAISSSLFCQPLLVVISRHARSGGFPGGSGDTESACNAGDPRLISGSGRSPGEGNGYPLHYSYLENPMHRGARWATVPRFADLGHDWATNICTGDVELASFLHWCTSHPVTESLCLNIEHWIINWPFTNLTLLTTDLL